MSKVCYCLKCRRELIAARCSKCGGMNEELPYSYETWVNYMSESEREAAIKTLTRGLRYAQLISMGDELLKSKSLLDDDKNKGNINKENCLTTDKIRHILAVNEIGVKPAYHTISERYAVNVKATETACAKYKQNMINAPEKAAAGLGI